MPATAPGNGKHAGFHIWAAYSYSPNARWADLVAEFLEAKSNPEALRVWINTTLGETFSDDYASAMSADVLLERWNRSSSSGFSNIAAGS